MDLIDFSKQNLLNPFFLCIGELFCKIELNSFYSDQQNLYLASELLRFYVELSNTVDVVVYTKS